jgi:Tol biopolymer transport system component
MIDNWKQAPLILKLIALIGIPLAGLFACGAVGVTIYLILTPRSSTSVSTTLTDEISETKGNYQGKIAYVKTTSRAGGEYDIYVSDADGSNARQLTNLPGLETSPSWSLDGQKIAFTATQDSPQPNDCATGYVELKCNFEIYTINVDGTNLKRLTNLPTYDRDPTWSNDGQKVAFSSREPGAQAGYIYVINADGSELSQLTDGFVRDTRPNWSPDGQRIAFTREICCESGTTNALDVYVMNADGTNVTRLTDDGDSANPVWSPDGQYIAWTTFRDETGKLGIMDALGALWRLY